jgi:hypothetical protein
MEHRYWLNRSLDLVEMHELNAISKMDGAVGDLFAWYAFSFILGGILLFGV